MNLKGACVKPKYIFLYFGTRGRRERHKQLKASKTKADPATDEFRVENQSSTYFWNFD